jgi:hypothetical protein
LRRDQGDCSGHWSLFQKIAKLSLKAAILKLGKGYYKIRPLNISRIPCNMHGRPSRYSALPHCNSKIYLQNVHKSSLPLPSTTIFHHFAVL